MPIKVTSNDKGVWITWGTPDEGISTTFRLAKADPDEEILKKLIRLTRFIASQMGELATEIEELEIAILGSSATASAGTTASVSKAIPSSVTAPDPNAPRIQMTPPASLSDQPAGGPPVSTFGWSSMPTTAVPSELSAPERGGWEMIPPEEMG